MSEQWADVVLLGIIQGLTEFLPVSSSGHLVLFQNVLGFKEAQLLLNVVLHAGTLGAILIVFGKDILTLIREAVGKSQTGPDPTRPKARSVIVYLIISTTALIYHRIFKTFRSRMPVAASWLKPSNSSPV